MDLAPNLLYFLQSNDKLPPVATNPEECIIGPNIEERLDGAPSWGNSSNEQGSKMMNNNGRKRKQCSQDAVDHLDDGETNASGSISKIEDSKKDDKIPTKSSTFNQGVGTFLSSGCCIIPNVLPPSFVSSCKQKATSDLSFLHSELQSRKKEAIATNSPHLLAAVQRGDFRELVKRDGKRCDVRFQLDRFPFTCPGLIYNSIIFPLVRELLGCGGGGEVSLLYAGVMWALSDEKNDSACPAQQQRQPQKWHGDGGHLFHHAHMPPHCINVFYPLVDITPDNGGTEFIPGSHIFGQFDMHKNEFGLCCKAGDAILFDYRVKHRGGANLSISDRPVLYLAYAKSFFRDAGNVRSGNSLVSSPSLSPVWVSRMLSGEPMRMNCGFEDSNGNAITSSSPANAMATNPTTTNDEITAAAEGDHQAQGSGERWVLFQMNIELDSGDPQTITVHNGDVASEVSSQFCKSKNLSDDFIPLLTGAIQQQIDAYMLSKKQ